MICRQCGSATKVERTRYPELAGKLNMRAKRRDRRCVACDYVETTLEVPEHRVIIERPRRPKKLKGARAEPRPNGGVVVIDHRRPT